MALSPFDLEQRRQQAARSLPANCFDDFLRLTRTLVHGPEFQWLLVDASHEGLRKQVMTALDGVLRAAGLRVNRLPTTRVTDAANLETRLEHHATQADVVHVLVSPGWFTPQRWDEFNVRRERLATQARARLVFWLDEDAIRTASQSAPDLWAWRGGVYAFRPNVPPSATERIDLPTPFQRHTALDSASLAERHRRVKDIREWLAKHPDAPDELKVAPMEELGRLLASLGELDEALDHLRNHELPLLQRLNNVLAQAIVKGQIADILQAQGQYDESLHIRQSEELPVYEQLRASRNIAASLGKVAEVLTLRGQYDDALHILQEGVLPVFERLGDQHAQAVTLARVANIHTSRDDCNKSLHILQHLVLPIVERLGDQRSRSATLSQIADVFILLGRHEEALRILRDEVLPVFERLGDQRERAAALGKIAGALHHRGKLDEALEIRRNQELPAYERLGDLRELMVGRTNLAILLQERNHPGDRDEALSLLHQALQTAQQLNLPEAALIVERLRTHEKNSSGK
jgi:tetratricopeptide (TPR) repeat protein